MGWLSWHVSWPIANGLTAKWSPIQLAVWCRIWKVRQPRHSYYAPPLIGGDIKRWCCLTSDVCLSAVRLSAWRLSVAYIGPKWRTERPRRIQPTSHVTRTHHSQVQKVRGQSHQAAFLTAALTRDAGAAVTVRKYCARESTATLCLLGGAWGTWAPAGE